MCWCVLCVIETTDRSDCQYTDILNGKTAEKYSKQHKDTKFFNKEITLFSRAMSLVQLQWWPHFIMSLSREITIQGLNMSYPKADFAWQGGSYVPQVT